MVVIITNINIDFNGDCNSSEFSDSINLSNESNGINIGKSINTSMSKSRSKGLNARVSVVLRVRLGVPGKAESRELGFPSLGWRLT